MALALTNDPAPFAGTLDGTTSLGIAWPMLLNPSGFSAVKRARMTWSSPTRVRVPCTPRSICVCKAVKFAGSSAHNDAEKRAVIGVDAASEVDCRLARDAADHRLTDEDSGEPAVEMNADMLAVAEVEGPRRRVEGGRDELTVGPDDGGLDRRARQKRDLARPVMDIELAALRAYAL